MKNAWMWMIEPWTWMSKGWMWMKNPWIWTKKMLECEWLRLECEWSRLECEWKILGREKKSLNVNDQGLNVNEKAWIWMILFLLKNTFEQPYLSTFFSFSDKIYSVRNFPQLLLLIPVPIKYIVRYCHQTSLA